MSLHARPQEPFSTTTTGPSLSARLAEPLSSTGHLLDLLVPPLHTLSLLPDQPDLVVRHGGLSVPVDPQRFVKRQLGLVQKVLVERVWPDWQAAFEAEEGKAALIVLERWFVPPTEQLEAGVELASEVALSAYSVLSSLLSGKAAQLQPRSLEIACDLLATLSTHFCVEQVYCAIFSSQPSGETQTDGADSDDEHGTDPASVARWERTLKDLVNIPTRVANAWGGMQENQKVPVGRPGARIPAALAFEPYMLSLASSFFDLLWRLSSNSSSPTPAHHDALASVLPPLLAAPAFAKTLLAATSPRFLPPTTFPTPTNELLQCRRHIDLWRSVLAELSGRDQSRFLRAILHGLEKQLSPGSTVPPAVMARGVAFVLDAFFGTLSPLNAELSKVATAVLLDQNANWNPQVVALAAVLWVGEEEKAKVALLEAAMGAWAAKDELSSASTTRRLYLTTLLLFAAASLPPQHPTLVSLSRSPAFLFAVSTHLSLVAPLQRLLGMLVAEVVSARTLPPDGAVQPLTFGDEIWQGDAPEKVTVRKLRQAVEEVAEGKARKAEGWQEALRSAFGTAQPSPAPRSLPKKVNAAPVQPSSIEEPPAQATKRPLISIIGEDSDDDLEPYPLPPAPSDATLDALASDDPALYHSAIPSPSSATAGAGGGASQTRKRGRLRPPVYVPELVAYLKGTDPEGKKEEADGEAERVEMGLKEGEALVRRKAGWGGELKENAIDLAFTVMGLQDNFELDGFDQLKQNILVALLTACPVEVAPVVTEQYFTNSYSVAQRHTLLAVLALSARELAGLPNPTANASQPPPPKPASFPSKQLPPALHRRLLGAEAAESGPLEVLSADLARIALSGAREDAESIVPGAAREKLLNVRSGTTTRTSVSSRLATARNGSTAPLTSTPSFATLAAEFFILPLINRLWLFLRDTATSATLLTSRARTAGTYMGGAPSTPALLDPYLLSKFLATLSVLVHAARHSPAFLAVIVPETLALVIALKPAPPSLAQTALGDDDDLDGAALNRDAVEAAALELALVALDGTVALDGGRALMSSRTVIGGSTLVGEVKDWAEAVFEAEERKGGELGGGVGRSGRAAAGVLLRVEEVLEKWRGAVGW
ncbi:hypothetical protein JCM10207_006893 [Rhodosporidiobolus poonsookiae]